jgi:anti-anti-sigma regulatory factor
MIIPDRGGAGRARVVGALTAETVPILLEAVASGVTVLDLAGVDEVDDAAVHVLTGLRAARCTLVACPRWLELWLVSATKWDS